MYSVILQREATGFINFYSYHWCVMYYEYSD